MRMKKIHSLGAGWVIPDHIAESMAKLASITSGQGRDPTPAATLSTPGTASACASLGYSRKGDGENRCTIVRLTIVAIRFPSAVRGHSGGQS